MIDKSQANASIATIAIWIATTLISIGAFLFSDDSWVVAIPLGVALVATLAIWVPSSEDKKSGTTNNSQSNSGTRGDSAYTMALLMEMMDEDEREEFKSQLKRRILSGESVTDESIIMEMEKRKRG